MAAVQVQLKPPVKPQRPRPTRWLAPLAAALAAVLVAGGGWHWLTAPERFPVRAVRLDGGLERVTQAQLRAAISPYLDRGLFGLDIARVREAVEELPWVAEASVRRRWPDALVIGVREHAPAARWNDGLMSDSGTVFRPAGELPAGLPVLSGPANDAAAVWSRYRRLSEIFAPAGLRITRLALDERRAWTAELDGGVVVQLGVDQDDAAAERFVRTLPRIGAPTGAELARVDLRYPNGFALAWASAPGSRSPGKKQ